MKFAKTMSAETTRTLTQLEMDHASSLFTPIYSELYESRKLLACSGYSSDTGSESSDGSVVMSTRPETRKPEMSGASIYMSGRTTHLKSVSALVLIWALTPLMVSGRLSLLRSLRLSGTPRFQMTITKFSLILLAIFLIVILLILRRRRTVFDLAGLSLSVRLWQSTTLSSTMKLCKH